MPGAKEKVAMSLVKLKRFLSIFAHNRRGMIGMLIISAFAVMALGAPLLTPYDPVGDKFITGSYSAPLWLKYVPAALGGMPGAAENMLVEDNAGFSDGLTEWNFTGGSNVSISYSSSIGDKEDGSAKITFTRNETGKTYGSVSVALFKRFYFPYSGSPRKFIANMSLLAEGTTQYGPYMTWEWINETLGKGRSIKITQDVLDTKVQMYMYLQRVSDGKIYAIWPYQSETSRGLDMKPAVFTSNKLPKPGLVYAATDTWISSGVYVADSDVIRYFNVSDTSREVFASNSIPGDFVFGVNLTFLDTNATRPVETSIYVDDFRLDLAGRVWGLMGSDHYGSDLWSQLVFGARISLYVGLLASILSVVLGLIVGLAAGYMGKYVDEFLMRFSDMLLVIPTLPLLIVLIAVLGPDLENLILLIGLLGWMGFARVVRSQVLSIKERPFVEAAKAVGAGKIHIMTKHILPNIISLVYVSLATSVPGAIVAEAALSFLGFYDPNKMSWGRMLYEVQVNGAAQYWWWVVPPGLCIAFLAVAFILLGFALDEVFNPRLRMRR